MSENPNLSLKAHKSCISTYTPTEHVSRSIQKRSIDQHPQRSQSEPACQRRWSQFTFKKHCRFCGLLCLNRNPKNPNRWRKVVKCRTANQGVQKTFKEVVLEKCDQRGDVWAVEVRTRVNGATSDLRAADGGYHDDSYKSFCSERNVKAAQSKESCATKAFVLSVM